MDEASADSLAPLMVTYFRSVWSAAHPASEIGQRNNNELEMLAIVIDKLLAGDMAGVGDMLMQRFRSVQLAAQYGWKVAQELELTNNGDATLVPPEMREEALRSYHKHSKVLDGLKKAKGGGRPQP